MSAKLASPFKFAPIPVALLALIVYLAVFASVLSFDELADVPKNLRGLDLDRGYDALSKITARPHPYISHANDDVRTYILSRLRRLTDRHDYIHLSDDLTSNVTYVAARDHAVYFEGTNVLLKIDGTDSPLASPESAPDGVLFSCHYDSVSSAPGATDDGMGVVTLLEMAEYFAQPDRRPRRTAIFFFNNGEEDQLNGAHAYFEHQWSNLTSTFINLEGAASGGRPVVFRSTSIGAARSLLNSAVKHPHGNILTSEAFSAGLIRSATDYEVYARGVEGEAPGIQGFDFAFYKNRAYYHTPRDSIPGMGHGEGRKALWAMMELVRGAGLSLLNDAEPGSDSRGSVYFDILGRAMVLFSLDAFYIFNIVFLVIGPLSAIGLIAWVMLASKQHSTPESVSATSDHSKMGKLRLALKSLAGWERFWIALIIGVLADVGLVSGYVHLNPYVIHSHAYAVLTAFLSLSFLAVVLPLQALHFLLPPTFVSQKFAVTLSLYSFTWLLLLLSTVAIATRQLSSLYWTTVLYLSAWSALVLELVRAVRRGDPGNEMGSRSDLFSTRAEREARAEGPIAGRRLVRGVRHEVPEHGDEDAEARSPVRAEAAHAEEGAIVETDPTEITPLMHQHRRVSQGGSEYLTLGRPGDVTVVGKSADEYGWWIGQMLVLVPATVLLLFQLEVLLLNALMHTLVDGSSPAMVYELLAVFSVLIFVPLTPFAHKLPQWLNALVAAVFVVLLAATWMATPFTQEWPFRVYFQQSVELSPASGLAVNPSVGARAPSVDVVRADTTLTGLKGYVDKYITPDIPSSWTSDVNCDKKGLRPDLMTCRWATDLLPSPTGNASFPASQWLDVKTTRLNASRALISVRGENTRGCRLYFDRAINFVYVHGQDGAQDAPAPHATMRLQGGYEMPAAGVKEARLWSRTWGKEFVVEVGWDAASDDDEETTLGGRAACEYAEYASALGPPGSGQIPAFEEVKQFLPLWALPTKLADGLVEVWTRFQL
ncbi:hypothetical protein OH76DRAFT_1352007 [Lentinus brumalis]|uniref:Peptide hydrolase n=1 Tax=Lentinus brumalis TaxID=2498619 RepID=A0A371D7T3_9APHY|nr:hypothetical protein OH76DRAFT_1352007 [Polyporus brumalis]